MKKIIDYILSIIYARNISNYCEQLEEFYANGTINGKEIILDYKK